MAEKGFRNRVPTSWSTGESIPFITPVAATSVVQSGGVIHALAKFGAVVHLVTWNHCHEKYEIYNVSFWCGGRRGGMGHFNVISVA